MSFTPPPNPPPYPGYYPYYTNPDYPKHGGYPHHYPGHPPPPPPHGHPYPYPVFVPGPVMMPYPVGYPSEASSSTYITNYIYNNQTPQDALPESSPAPEILPITSEEVKVAENSGDHDWVPTTSTLAGHLTGRAVIGGHEGWDGSPLWVIRAYHEGDLVPGKLSVRHNTATIAYDGKDVSVQNIEVLCANADELRWIPASNGDVPPNAVHGGSTVDGETLFVGRARYQLSVTPGKVVPSQNSCVIPFAGSEVSLNTYDVLCRAS